MVSDFGTFLPLTGEIRNGRFCQKLTARAYSTCSAFRQQQSRYLPLRSSMC